MPSTTNATKAAKAIKKIKQEVLWPETVDAPKSFQYYKIGKDYMRRLSYVTCKILAENVNEGTDPSKETKGYIQAIGCGDDELSYIIPKSLGGCGERFNVFPAAAVRFMVSNLNLFNFQLKHGKREQDETKVREYLKSGENKSATLTFGLEYSTKTEEEEEEETLTW